MIRKKIERKREIEIMKGRERERDIEKEREREKKDRERYERNIEKVNVRPFLNITLKFNCFEEIFDVLLNNNILISQILNNPIYNLFLDISF